MNEEIKENLEIRVDEIRKNDLDKHNYRYIKLKNEIKCMLVQDKSTTKSAAFCFVNSGSLNDPPEVNGLAHFCEHMLFLGTEKYPDDTAYINYLTSHGGSRNAATGEDFTYYYFDVKNEALDGALDIFSEFFKKPQFTEKCTRREMEAVESEFKKNLNDEGRRII